MTRFPLPPGYRVVRRRKWWVCVDGDKRLVSRSGQDSRYWRLVVWDVYLGWA